MNAKNDDIAADVRTVKAADGVALLYEVLGQGPPLALLHGGLVGRSAFSRQRELLAANYRLILPSMRAHDGADATLPPDYGIATSDVSDLAAVLDAEGAERAVLIGHSSGGATAYAFARQYPERVERLTLIEPTLLNLLPVGERERVTRAVSAIIAIGESEGDGAALRASLEFLGGAAWRKLDAEKQSARLAAMAPMAAIMTPHWRALLAFDVGPADLQALSPPTLLFYGRDSFEFQPLIAEVWRNRRPDLELIMVDGAGHNVHHNRPDIVNPAIAAFLNGP
jgi:pimeloyl-ACP methyl ester carboxylesterase